MILADLTKISSVEVFKDHELAGTLRRTPNGSVFEYEEKFYQKALADGRPGLSISINLQKKIFVTVGDNLHPFFAGLLPEGARLTALQRSVKTSADDMFSLLIASGEDLIGDIWVKLADQQKDRKRRQAATVSTSLSELSFQELFKQSISSNLYEDRLLDPSLPGVQSKISAQMISFPVNFARRNKRYILKLGSKEYPRLVENEHYFMLLAKQCGIETANTQLVEDGKGEKGLLVERFDRIYDQGARQMRRIQQEDVCQVLSRYPSDKYRLSTREALAAVAANVSAPIVEISKLISAIAFSYIIGNGDMHAKNISIIRSPITSELALSPIYDLLTTIPYGDDKLALQIEGKANNLSIRDFVALGKRHDIPEKATRKQIALLLSRITTHLSPLSEIGLPAKKTAHLERTIRARMAELHNS